MYFQRKENLCPLDPSAALLSAAPRSWFAKPKKATQEVLAAETATIETVDLSSEPSIDLLDEFTPEFIAEANALCEKILRKSRRLGSMRCRF